MYINCKTYFSFRYGTFSTKELVKTAADKGIGSLALTNINSTCDIWDFVKLCQEEGIKPISGTEIRNGDRLLYILLAANNRGLQWIHEFLSVHLLAKKEFPENDLDNEFFKSSADGFVIYPMDVKPLDRLLINERIGVLPWEVNKLFALDLKKHADKFVIRQPVTVQNKTYYNLHRLLRCIDKNILLSKLPVESQANPEEVFVSPSELIDKFRHYPSIVTNTYKLMESCVIEMDFFTDKNKQTYGGTKEDDRILLEKLAVDGFSGRYGKKDKAARERLFKELKIIDELGFNSYFLINYDIIRYAQSRGFYYVGRGSGANSIVAYCLRITDVDPIELNLYFERFLNPHRTSPPDFDIDFSWTDRDEVIDYIFKRYGKNHVTLMGAYSTFKHDAIIQQLGKVFGLPKDEIDELKRSNQATDKIKTLILQYGNLLYGFPNILTLHACGMLISEKPITAFGSLWMPPKGFPTIQMDMHGAENVGLNKFDILSQRGLGHIKECLRLIKANKGIEIDIHAVEKFKHDAGVATQIREANTIGCFYIESPAMRGLLKKLRCDDYLTLVAASSIIRPGVAQSGMMRAYIERFHDRSKIDFLHPVLKELLEETFGVMVFQEDVIKVAHYFAGLDLGEADVLRRAMKLGSGSKFQLVKDKYMESCATMGHTKELASEVWRQMESFAGYSFNKAHSASFAVESYMSLYLKTYFPKEFMVAVINNFGGFYSRELYFLELLKTGGEIKAPCINNSDYYTNITGNEVYTGFIHIKSLQQTLAENILDERKNNGPYLHLQNFIERTNIGQEQLNILVSVGAFRFTSKSKKTLLWEANFLQKKNQPELHGAPVLFEDAPLQFNMPTLIDNRLDDLYDEMEILDFTLSNPFLMVDEDPGKYLLSKDLAGNLGKIITVLAYFIARKHVTTKNDDHMFFGTFVDCNLDWIDTVHFPDSAKNFPLHNSGFYKITGKVTDDFGVYSLEVSKMYKVGYKERKFANL
ncbi:MAG: DNA polymerase III subunit alpha [Chitinophagaceae bacterium]|nr:DNA polymerase III subunit alpha [Chitinophagaceae bacterium]